jgi:prolyl-tRNA synthetase
LFLRTTEFLWQEGHTAHETSEEAMEETLRILNDVYLESYEQVMAIPPYAGRKSAAERFPGAVETYTLEALMRDRKALQSCTSHYLGQNFAKAYGVRFLGRDGAEELAYATSWGLSTRAVGAVIMTHGDDKGLRLPPALAPIQAVIVPIYRNDDERSRVLEGAEKLLGRLPVRGHLDDRDDLRPGFKFNDWELKGVPVRLELGPRDLDADQAVVVRRDGGEKEIWPLDRVAADVEGLLRDVQTSLFDQAKRFRDEHTFRPGSYDELRSMLEDPGGFTVAPWCADPGCETKVKAETKATIRFLPIEPGGAEGACIVCGRPATEEAAWAQAY